MAGHHEAKADDLFWTNPAGGSFQTPGNWSLARVPGPTDAAIFSSDGLVAPFSVTLAADATIRKLLVREGTPTLDLGGRSGSVGDEFRISGPAGAGLRLTNGHFGCAGVLFVGWDQSGSFELEGVTATTSRWNGAGGGNPPSVGEMTVRGSLTRFTKTDCCDSTIGQGAGNSGRLFIVDGAEVHWGQGFFSVGREGGTGELSISGGGVLSIDPGSAAVGTGSGRRFSSIGWATISGAHSRWQVGSSLLIGHAEGIGSLRVTGGGAIVATDLDVGVQGGTGDLRVESGSSASVSGGVRVGDSGGSGTLVVTGSKAVFATGNLGVGFGANGAVRVDSGGRIESVRGEFGGQEGSGSAEIRGAGSRWDASFEFVIGSVGGSSLTVGSGGVAEAPLVFLRELGRLEIEEGGRMACDELHGSPDATLSIAAAPVGPPPVLVSGPAVLSGHLTVPAMGLAVGETRELISANPVVGRFSSISAPDHHVVTLTASSVRVTRVPPDGGDCDGNGVPDELDLKDTPWRDFDGSGILDICEDRTHWLGGAEGELGDPANWSGGLPGGSVTAILDGGFITLVTTLHFPGGAFPQPILVRSGAFTLELEGATTVPSLTIESGGLLQVSGSLEVLGDATILPGASLLIDYDGWLSVDGRLDCRPQSKLSLGLRPSAEPFVSAATASFLGGLEVGTGSVSPWTVEPGSRFTLASTANLESETFFASLFAMGIGPNLLGVVGPGGSSLAGFETLVVEVTPLSSFLSPQDGGSAPVTGLPTALETAELTGDDFDDVAITVSFGAETNGFLYVIRSDGTGEFVAAQGIYPTGIDPQGVRSGFFDQTDTNLDLAVTSAGSATLRAYRNLSQTVGGFVAGEPVATIPDPRGLAVVPSPGGEASLAVPSSTVVITAPDSNAVQAFASQSLGGFTPGTQVPMVPPRPPRPISPIPGTSRPVRSMAFATSGGAGEPAGGVHILDVSGPGQIALSSVAIGPARPTDLESRDLDGDGFGDVLVASEAGTVTVLRGTATGAVAASGSFPVGVIPAKDSALGDFDGDGRPDLAVALLDAGGGVNSRVRLFRNDSVPGQAATFRAAGDFAQGQGVRLLERAKTTPAPNDELVTVRDGVPGGFLHGDGSTVTLIRFTNQPFVPCLGDLNLDGTIDGADLAVVLTGWRQPGLSDLDGDGTTGPLDLGLVLSAWAGCGD